MEESYNNKMPVGVTQARSKRYLQSRMQIILTAISKLRGCVRQVEYLNPSGASKQDIVSSCMQNRICFFILQFIELSNNVVISLQYDRARALL